MTPIIPRWTWINRQDALLKFLDVIADSSWLALDTEFLRIRTYYPKLCLIQVSDGSEHGLIDAQAELDLSPLVDRLRQPDTVKALHACLQDIEIFHHDFDLIPENVFDTQVAWALLGYGYQVSYAAIVEKELGITLDKSQVRSWWDRRPLKPAQLQYAMSDVVYLGPIYQKLSDELEARGRLGWLQAEMSRILKPSTWIPDPDQIWKRIRSPNGNAPRGRLHVLQELARWRELTARHHDQIRSQIASDEVLTALACTPRMSREDFDLAVAGGGSWKLRNSLWKALQKAEKATPISQKRMSRSELAEQRRQVRILARVARKVAKEIKVAPELLAPRVMLEELVQQDPNPTLLQGWRGEMVGSALTDAVNAL